MTHRTYRRVLLTLTVVGLAAFGGCAAIAWPIAAFAPAPKVEAQYELPAGRRVLVFPDDLINPISYPPLKRSLAEKLNKQLAEHVVAEQTVPYNELLNLSTTEGFDRLPVDRVGAKLGADVVVYVDIDEFRLKNDAAEPLWSGKLTVFVRVVDVGADSIAGKRLWPKDGSRGHELTIETPMLQESSKTYGAVLADEMAARMADKIAKLFYKHEGPRPGDPEPRWQ